MNKIIKITATTDTAYFLIDNNETIMAASEFKATSGELDGLMVYTESLKLKDSNQYLSVEQINELLHMYDEYKIEHNDIIEFI